MTSTSTEMSTERSDSLFNDAQRLMPGGVSSPVRAFRSVGGTPRFIERGEGAHLIDADGNKYIDYVLSWGPLILGHAHPRVIGAIIAQAGKGTTFGAPTELETELARRITALMPAVEMVRFVSSGTEAVMSALRLARAVTGRNKILKFAGCYHGHADGLLVQAGSGVATLGLPDSPGVAAHVAADTLTAQYNDASAVDALCAARDVAAIIVEPVVGNMGLVTPKDGFLQSLRDIANRTGTLLVLDEVMTGFRVALGGAQSYYGITPDITCLGKVMGGGLPAAAYGGRRDLMMRIAPAGNVYQAGTLSGNPLAMAAGIATLDEIAKPGVFDTLAQTARSVVMSVEKHALAQGVGVQAASVGSMWGFYFTDHAIQNYDDARAHANTARFGRFFHNMLQEGVYLAPSQFEAAFVSTMHDAAVLDHTDTAIANAMKDLSAIS